MARIDYDSATLMRSEEYYRKLELASEAKEIIDPLAEFLAKAIGMEEGAVKGFVWMAVNEWQRRNETDVASLTKASGDERKATMAVIANAAEVRLLTALRNPHDFMDLEEMCREGFAKFLKKHSKKW